MEKKWSFDRAWTKDFTKLRQEFISEFLAEARHQMRLASALDVGCGIGDFSKFLADLNFRVLGLDGRQENVEEARRRNPGIAFEVVDAEDLPVSRLGKFDLVLCFGLLYHLENPFRVIRHLHAVTSQLLLIETMRVPGAHATMALLDEGVVEDQGLNYVAFYPSESCLIKMLYRAGFPRVWRFSRLPKDELFSPGLWRKQQRTFLIASKVPISAPNLILVREPVRHTPGALDPWGTSLSRGRHLLVQIRVRVSKAVGPILKAVGAKPR
jgi:SAM-dependent methyltransferase